MMFKRMLVVICSFYLFACNYPENEEILGTWNSAKYETQEEADKWLSVFGQTYSVFEGKCNERPDYFKFEPDGVFQSTIVGHNCVDSITQTGTWEISKRNLDIRFYHNDLTISAKVEKLTSDRLIIEAEALNKYGTQLMIFWRKE